MIRALCVLVLLVLPLSAKHAPLLPRPRHITYGEGRLPLRGVSISLGSTPLPEDRFAAGELASALSQFTGAAVPVVSGRATAPSIVLNRTGAVDALPGPDDPSGPDSRESYELRIHSAGAEVRARSSAGLYYAVQTMRQLLEGHEGAEYLPEVEIRDWPSLPYRGFMMDISHGPLPTEEEIRRQIDFLARWKTNQYYLYSEANIEVRGYPRSPCLNRPFSRG